MTLNLHCTFQVTPAHFGAQPVRRLGIAAFLAHVAGMTKEALIVQQDGAGLPCPVMEHTKVGTDWAVWSVQRARWTSVMTGGTCVDDVVLALIDRMSCMHSHDVELLVCPPGTIQPAFLS